MYDFSPKKKHPRQTGKIIALKSCFCIVIGFLTSCTIFPQPDPLPTLIPEEQIPTVIVMTANAVATQTAAARREVTQSHTPDLIKTPIPSATGPSLTATNTTRDASTPTPTDTQTQASTPTITKTPTNTATALPTEIPFAAVQMIYPNHHSKVVSPIDLYTFLAPGGDGRIRVELFGEDGRLLYRQVFLYTDTPAGARVNLKTNIRFEIPGAAETARLVVSVNDEHEQLKSLASVELVLLADGPAELNPSGDLLENIFIQQPAVKSLIQGDSLLVTGLARTGNNQPLLVEIITTDGRVIGSRLAGIAPLEEGGEHRLFASEVPFSVTSPTWARVTIYDNSGRLPGPRHVSSVEVLLSP
jgi:hypothetical protein